MLWRTSNGLYDYMLPVCTFVKKKIMKILLYQHFPKNNFKHDYGEHAPRRTLVNVIITNFSHRSSKETEKKSCFLHILFLIFYWLNISCSLKTHVSKILRQNVKFYNKGNIPSLNTVPSVLYWSLQ